MTISKPTREIAADGEDAPDVLPASINTLLATLWVILFGGRWLIVPLLQATGLLSLERTADWDEGIFAKVYLILLSITCVVLALRAVRGWQSPGVGTETVSKPVSIVDGDSSAPRNGAA